MRPVKQEGSTFRMPQTEESAGFTTQEARRLVWARWAVRSKRLGVG